MGRKPLASQPHSGGPVTRFAYPQKKSNYTKLQRSFHKGVAKTGSGPKSHAERVSQTSAQPVDNKARKGVRDHVSNKKSGAYITKSAVGYQLAQGAFSTKVVERQA